MKFPVVIPQLGATGGDVKIVEWHAAEGTPVLAGAVLLTVETDKSTVDIEAFRSGHLRSVVAGAGAELAPGAVVAWLTDTADEPIEESPAQGVAAPAVREPVHARPAPQATPTPVAVVQRTDKPDRRPAGERLTDAFATMVLIRRYEEHLYHLFLQGLVPGTLHQCQGQEAVAVGVCSALRVNDLVYSTHRPVGHLIAKGASLDAITAEIWGKATGCVGGKGGQMHLADFSVGAMVSNAIVGANIPIATGSAMAFRLRGLDNIAVSFFGDGASNIGAFHEGLNLAAVQRAPVVFVCENNLYAASTHISQTTLVSDISVRAASYGMPGVTVDGMDVEAVFRAAATAVARARAGKGPTLIECKTYRYRGHSRGDPGGYRDKAEHQEWRARDPIERLRARLVDDLQVNAHRLTAIEDEAQAKVETAVAFALASPDPDAASARQHVFVEEALV